MAIGRFIRRPKSSPYITRQGYERLQQEFTYLWKVKRPEVTRKVSEAAAQGDRSENAEYIYGKRPWVFWQYTGTGSIPGIEGPVDINVFQGTRTAWNKWLKANSR